MKAGSLGYNTLRGVFHLFLLLPWIANSYHAPKQPQPNNNNNFWRVFTSSDALPKKEGVSASGGSGRPPKRVVITGAGPQDSQLGFLLFSKLMKRKSPAFYAVGIVSDKRGSKELLKLGANPDQIKIADITQKSSLTGVFDKADKVVICSSARPKKYWRRRVKDFLKRYLLRKGTIPTRPHDMYYEKGEQPYQVDYIGRHLIYMVHTHECAQFSPFSFFFSFSSPSLFL